MNFFSRVAVTLLVFLSVILPAKADITDGHFSTNQIFDVQYYWSGTTLNASNFIAPYDMNFSHPTVGAGQYFAFFNSTTNPGTYGLGLYNSDGTLAQVVHNTGTLQAIGPDALFYVGSGFFGTVITTSAGYNYGDSASFTNMDTSVSAADATGYTWASTTPLSAGQTAGGGGAPTVVSTAAGTPVVSTSSSTGATTTTVVDTPGVTSTVTTTSDARGTNDGRELTITRTTTQVSTTPVTRVTTDTTPVTTTTTTTPTTVTTYSDGSTTTTNGTPVVTTSTANQVVTTTTNLNTVTTTNSNQDYVTRIDQYTVLANTNSFVNLLSRNDILSRQSIVDGEIAFRGNVGQEGTVSFYSMGERTGDHTVDGYTVTSKKFGFGIDKLVSPRTVIGLNLSRSETAMSGNGASGGLNKDIVNVYSMSNVRNWLFTTELGYANNEMTTTHSMPELGYSNSSRAAGSDRWVGLRVYTPDFRGLRPFVGYRVEQNLRDAAADQGSALTAVSYAAVDRTVNRNEVGVRFDRNFGTVSVYGEYAQTNDSIKISRLGIRKDLNNRLSFAIGATQLQQHDIRSVAGTFVLRIGF